MTKSLVSTIKNLLHSHEHGLGGNTYTLMRATLERMFSVSVREVLSQHPIERSTGYLHAAKIRLVTTEKGLRKKITEQSFAM